MQQLDHLGFLQQQPGDLGKMRMFISLHIPLYKSKKFLLKWLETLQNLHPRKGNAMHAGSGYNDS